MLRYKADTAKVSEIKEKVSALKNDPLHDSLSFQLPAFQKKDSLPFKHPALPRYNRDSADKYVALFNKRLVDSLKNKAAAPKPKPFFKIGGSLSNQYEYGAVPYYLAGSSVPAAVFRSSGNLQVSLGKLPLRADYFYATPRFISGLNNYFNIRLDVEELSSQLKNEGLQKTQALGLRADTLEHLNQTLYQKLAYLQMLDINRMHLTGRPSMPDARLPQLPRDSLKLPDSLLVKGKLYADSLRSLYDTSDSLNEKMAQLKGMIEENSKAIRLIRQKVSAVTSPKPGVSTQAVFPGNRFRKALAGFKKLEVGICYPSYSTFMVNQVAVKGINTQYTFKNAFIDATYGNTVVNYSLQPLPNSMLNQIRNLTSLFDWNNNPDGKKIAAAKLGIGNESKSYLGFGGLIGRGTLSPLTADIRTNYVFEIDGRLIYKFITFESAFAKSFMSNTVTPTAPEQYGAPQANSRTSSFQGKVSGVVPKAKTKVMLLYRRVEPNFKSFASGFMRSDIQRYESRLEQPVGNKFKLGFNYRRDQDNLLHLSSFSTILQNFIYSASTKLFRKKLELTLNYTEIYQHTSNTTGAEEVNIKSNIKTTVITYSPRLRKMTSVNTAILNLYELNTTGQQTNRLYNYSFNSFNQYKKWRVNGLNAYNMSTNTDSLNFSNAVNNTLELGYQFSELLNVTVSGKHMYAFKTKSQQTGYALTVNLKIHKLLNLELRAEKLVLGDFINTLNYTSIQKFPYYGYIKVISNF